MVKLEVDEDATVLPQTVQSSPVKRGQRNAGAGADGPAKGATKQTRSSTRSGGKRTGSGMVKLEETTHLESMSVRRKVVKPDPATAVKVEPKAKRAKSKSASAPAKGAAQAAVGPFPSHSHPTVAECYAAWRGLGELHGFFDTGASCPPEETDKERQDARQERKKKKEEGEVLDALVGTILSQNTTDDNSRRAFASLKSVLPTWADVLAAKPAKVIEAIKMGGLAETKTYRIQTILSTLVEERGSPPSMEYVRELDNDAVKAELGRFKGVGPKTISCVLMFCLQRAEFPVDTHVWRISKQMGWVPAKASREETYEHMNKRVPDLIKYDLHCQLVEHGKCCVKCCAQAGKPRKQPVGECPLKVKDWSTRVEREEENITLTKAVASGLVKQEDSLKKV